MRNRQMAESRPTGPESGTQRRKRYEKGNTEVGQSTEIYDSYKKQSEWEGQRVRFLVKAWGVD